LNLCEIDAVLLGHFCDVVHETQYFADPFEPPGTVPEIAWFKTCKGEYGEGDKFNAVSVPKKLNPRKIVPVGTMARFADRG
jgi:hypothetical protein